MQKCRVCGCTDFYKEAGYFFCQTCQTQNEDIREEVLDIRVDPTTRLRKIKLRQARSDKSGEPLGWTSWEVYNFILIGLTNELIELGVPIDIKLTILQLWATYLGKVEVAFISTKRKCIPKLAKRYNKKDAEIIYGKMRAQKKARKRKRGNSSTSGSMMSSFTGDGSSSRDLNRSKRLMINAEYDRYIQSQSQASSEGDALSSFNQSVYSIQSTSGKSSDNESRIRYSSYTMEEFDKLRKLSKDLPRKKRVKYRERHVRTQYKKGPAVITPMKLWAIIYIALRIHNQPIHLADMLRYGREGHLSYYKLDHLLPSEITLKKSEYKFLSQNVELTHKGMRQMIATMSRFLGFWNMECPDFGLLTSRYCQELGLPRGILLYTERLIALAPPKMSFNINKSHVPNYEGRAMAYIIVVLKILLGLDDITENAISQVAEKINNVATDRRLLTTKLFSFQEWQKYIECRKTILVNSHYPTKLKYSPDSHGIDNLYIKFLEFINSKGERDEPDVGGQKHFLSEELIMAMKKYITEIDTVNSLEKEIELFPPSVTPLHSYLRQLLNHPLYDIPLILQNDFFFTKVGYLTRPEMLQELADQCEIQLDIVDSNLHFLEKLVPPFEQPRMPNVNELKESVEVEDTDLDKERNNTERSENVNDYLHKKIPSIMKFNTHKQQYCDIVHDQAKNSENFEIIDDFSFNAVLSNGRLAIPANDESDSENETWNNNRINVTEEDAVFNKIVHEKYNLDLSNSEKRCVWNSKMQKEILFKKKRMTRIRNKKGQFLKYDKTMVKVETEDTTINPEDAVLETNDSSYLSNTFLHFMEWVSDELDQVEGNVSYMCEGIDKDVDITNFHNILDLSQISILDNALPSVTQKRNSISDKKCLFFRPFKEYWMYHCIFSRVKPKNFDIFEKMLPRNFRWLLTECAHIVEMPSEDLYEEVCLIEAYYSQILKPNDDKLITKDNSVESSDSSRSNIILARW